ncbi:MAG TPA: class E sortase [Sporichthyaceae bacterium]|jgi:sortase A|nr:class E sortase [Sporichthyaceae bacterium]
MVGVVGELMITFGLVLMLLVAYQLWWTNIEADHKANQIDNALHQAWSQGNTIPNGAIGIMYIERLGKSWEKPIVQGVTLDDLAQGVGHFTNTAAPGQPGNFAVAGHRATHGQPFAYLNELQPNDTIVIETKTDWYVYTVDTMPGTKGQAWKLVNPNDGAVLEPVPEDAASTQAGFKLTKDEITLVTCNPRWGSSTRMIVYGHLTADYKKSGPNPQIPPALQYFQGS